MRHLRVLKKTLACALSALLVVTTLSCTTKSPQPRDVVQSFLEGLNQLDTNDAAEITTNPSAAALVIGNVRKGLQARGFSGTVTSTSVSGSSGSVSVRYEWLLPNEWKWSYTGEVLINKIDGTWKVRWTPKNIHPDLGERQTLTLHGIAANPASVIDGTGTEILRPGIQYRLIVNKQDKPSARGALLGAKAILGKAFGSRGIEHIISDARGEAHTVTMVDEHIAKPVADRLNAIPGLSFTAETALIKSNPQFAPDLVARITTSVEKNLVGQRGWSVELTNDNGVEIKTLGEQKPVPVPSIRVSLDHRVQNAAQQALDGRKDQAMMVVIQPSTGRLLAVAQTPAADKEGDLALNGLYPPGSSFKIVTSAAAIQRGLATPDTIVPCPGSITIGHRVIPNYNGFSLGDVSMEKAFAHSCNTSFAHLASRMPGDALHKESKKFGLGLDYTVEGLRTMTGSVPVASDMNTRIEDGFGQGKVLASPFGLALVTASVAAGHTVVPYLIAKGTTKVKGSVVDIDSRVRDGLRREMRAVVLYGSGAGISHHGDVYAKTGESEVAGGSHSWFVGYRGDLAFATLIVKGGGSQHAVTITDRFFSNVPAVL